MIIRMIAYIIVDRMFFNLCLIEYTYNQTDTIKPE